MEQAAGLVSAGQVGMYPPGDVLLTAGERVDQFMVDFLKTRDPARVFGLPEAGRLLCVDMEGVMM
jgi:arginine/lysine/ornithine decarboxylase